MTEHTFTKGDETRTAGTPTEAVKLEFDGWVEAKYDKGGSLPAGTIQVTNDTGQAEPVVTELGTTPTEQQSEGARAATEGAAQ